MKENPRYPHYHHVMKCKLYYLLALRKQSVKDLSKSLQVPYWRLHNYLKGLNDLKKRDDLLSGICRHLKVEKDWLLSNDDLHVPRIYRKGT